MKTLSVLLILIAGCDSASTADYETVRQLGTPDMEGEAIAAPDMATAGEPFEVTVTTEGGGCHERADGIEVRERREVVELRPYDIVSMPVGDKAGCTLIRKTFPRTVAVTLDDAGPRRLRVVGRQSRDGSEVVVEREILVVSAR